MKNILLIATGGTIASVEDGGGLRPALAGEELARYVPEVAGLCELDVVQPMNIDSTNMRPADWMRIRDEIVRAYDAYDGFVVLHGTDTMAYTAAALSYLIQKSPKPIVLTGSQKPMASPFTDAKLNVYQSLLYAADDRSRDVSVVFGGAVIAGTRARKQRTMSFNAFSSVNFPEVALIRNDRIVRAGAPMATHAQGEGGASAPLVYDRLDERGLMAWIDLPLMRSPYLGDVFYFPTERFRANGREQLREIVAQNFNHPSVVMWGIFSLVWQRGDDVTPYIRELHTALKRVDPSRPTVALSNQDGELNTITDLIALKQNVGWMRGTTDDVGYWCETLHKSWGNLLAAPCYGVPGYPSQQDDLLGRPTPGTHWLPERWQTRFHEEYARRIVSDPAFWGEWVNAMFDFGTARGANDRYACGMVTLDRRQKKDIYYLYRTLWNRREPTLYIAERRWRVRPSAEQRIKVYSSGEDPVLLVNGDSVALTKYAEGQFRADCKLLPGENRIEARCGELRDSVALRVGTALKARDFEALRKTKGLRSKD